MIGRFDLSKTQRPVFEAHPEWFFRRANGEPVDLQRTLFGLHQRRLLPRARADDSRRGARAVRGRRPVLQHVRQSRRPTTAAWRRVRANCEACQIGYRARYGRPVPAAADADYRAFMAESSREVAASIAELIQRKRPDAAFLTYIQDHTDGIMSESNTAVGAPAAALALLGQRQREPVARVRTGQAGDQSGDELHRLSVALRPRAPGRDRAAPVPEHRAWRAARYGRVGADGPAGPQRAGRGEADLRLARATRGSLRGPEERRTRPAARQRRHGVVSRVLSRADRGAHSVRGVRESALAGGRLALRSGDRAWRAGPGARRLRAARAAGCWSRARRRRRCRSARSPAGDSTQGYWRIHDRTRTSVAEGHRPGLHRWRVSGDRAAASVRSSP